MLVFLVVLVVFVVVGITAWTMRNRTERGIESGISSFRRELDALAPRGDPKARPLPRPRAPADDEGDDDEQGFRTVQIGEKPPPRKLTPPTLPSSGADDAAGATRPESTPAADNADDGDDVGADEPGETDEERADGS